MNKSLSTPSKPLHRPQVPYALYKTDECVLYLLLSQFNETKSRPKTKGKEVQLQAVVWSNPKENPSRIGRAETLYKGLRNLFSDEQIQYNVDVLKRKLKNTPYFTKLNEAIHDRA